MCGIISVFIKYPEKNIKEIIESEYILKNRGPDYNKLIKTPHILGFRRLSINDKSKKSMQPFILGDISVLCNGEIFNHKQLEEKYNINCKSLSDCECILHLYKKLGFKDTITQLRGDFAIIIIDKDKMYFGRDRIGVRPLFIGKTNSNNIALASYARVLTKYCKNIEQISPGWGVYDSKSENISLNYYDFPINSITDSNIQTIIQKTLTRSVQDRLMSDRPIGCLLSGGLDSSIIVSILCKLLGPNNVRTYSIGMEGSVDLEHARIVADTLGTKHHEVKFTAEEGFNAIPNVIRDLESYDITTIRASVGMWLLAKWISENSDDVVLMSGEGSDELFCGYLYFHYAPNSNALQRESLLLIKNLYKYDVLRADRCISSHGLELRVPFLDHELIDIVLNIPPVLKEPYNGVEKHILRMSFIDDYLPDQVLWRRKDGMSDGISGKNKKWYEHIQDFVKNIITNDIYDEHTYPSREAQYYRLIYNKFFPSYQPKYDYWMPKWVDHGGDPSGRILEIFKK